LKRGGGRCGQGVPGTLALGRLEPAVPGSCSRASCAASTTASSYSGGLGDAAPRPPAWRWLGARSPGAAPLGEVAPFGPRPPPSGPTSETNPGALDGREGAAESRLVAASELERHGGNSGQIMMPMAPNDASRRHRPVTRTSRRARLRQAASFLALCGLLARHMHLPDGVEYQRNHLRIRRAADRLGRDVTCSGGRALYFVGEVKPRPALYSL
jgi:hypothetical protein